MERPVVGIYSLEHLKSEMRDWLKRPTSYSSQPARIVVGQPRPDQAKQRTYFMCRTSHKEYRSVMQLQAVSIKKGAKGKFYPRKQYYIARATYDVWYTEWADPAFPLPVRSYNDKHSALKALDSL